MQMNESIQYGSIDYVKKAIKAERREDWPTLETGSRFCAVSTLARCVTGALATDADEFSKS